MAFRHGVPCAFPPSGPQFGAQLAGFLKPAAGLLTSKGGRLGIWPKGLLGSVLRGLPALSFGVSQAVLPVVGSRQAESPDLSTGSLMSRKPSSVAG